MRTWHLLFAVFVSALVLAVGRDEVGRVALVVFFTGLVEVFFGTIALMTLFQTVAAIGNADRPVAYLSAVGATAIVLLVATATMNGVYWLGLWMMDVVVPGFAEAGGL